MLSQFYPPIMGGEERHVRNLARELVARGHQVGVVTLATDGHETVGKDDDITVWQVRGWSQKVTLRHRGADRPYAPPIPDPGVTLRLRKIVAEFQPDIIHGHNWMLNSAYPIRNGRVPIVSTLHNYGHRCVTHRMMYRDIDPCDGPSLRKCADCASIHYGKLSGPAIVAAHRLSAPMRQRRTAAFVSVSNAVARHARQSPQDKVIHNFIPPVDEIDQIIRTTPRPAFVPDGDFVLFVGDVTVDKGVQVLLDAWGSMTPPCPLVIVGRTHDLPIDRPGVVLAGPQDHSVVLATMAAARIVVVPSRWADPCPTVVLEAMAAGTAVVGSGTGGISDMIQHGVTGLLVPPSDAPSLAHALERLLGDSDLTDQLARDGRERVKAFTVPVIVEEIEAVYRQATNRFNEDVPS